MLYRVILPLLLLIVVCSATLLHVVHSGVPIGQLQPVVTAGGLLFAAVTFILNAWNTRVQARQQHTLTILFDTRLSPEFRAHLERRKRFFAEGEKVDAETFWAYLNATRNEAITDAEALERRHCAEAIRSLLNYYEFLCLGIRRRDLDEGMLRGSIRGIMCALVVDMFDIIEAFRAKNPHAPAFESLITIYNRWRGPEDPVIPHVPPTPWARFRRRIAEGLRDLAARLD